MYAWWNDGAAYGRVPVTDRLRFTESGRQLYFHESGALKHFGDHFINPDLAQTLTRIADHGWRTFYEGDIAEEIAADMAAHGGLLSRKTWRRITRR